MSRNPLRSISGQWDAAVDDEDRLATMLSYAASRDLYRGGRTLPRPVSVTSSMNYHLDCCVPSLRGAIFSLRSNGSQALALGLSELDELVRNSQLERVAIDVHGIPPCAEGLQEHPAPAGRLRSCTVGQREATTISKLSISFFVFLFIQGVLVSMRWVNSIHRLLAHSVGLSGNDIFPSTSPYIVPGWGVGV